LAVFASFLADLLVARRTRAPAIALLLSLAGPQLLELTLNYCSKYSTNAFRLLSLLSLLPLQSIS